MKRKTNFDRYLEEHLKDQGFAERFRKAGEAWDAVTQQSDAPKAIRCAKSPDRRPRIQNPASRIQGQWRRRGEIHEIMGVPKVEDESFCRQE